MRREVTSIDFGEWMAKKRKGKGMRQRDLARKSNCHEADGNVEKPHRHLNRRSRS